MPAVKGSKQPKMIVVAYRPALLWAVALVLLGSLTLAVWLGHSAGRSAAQRDIDAALQIPTSESELTLQRAKEIARSPDQLITILRENNELKQKLVSLERSAAIDKEALAAVQDELVSQRDTIAQLQEDLMFYRQIAAPDSAAAEQGLVIGSLDLVAGRQAGRVRYKIEFRQQGGSDKLEGYANVTVVGDQDGERVSLPLHELATGEQEQNIPLGFRYFQNVEGELELPEGFSPLRMQVLAVVEGKNAKRVEKSFGWSVRN